jgi:hypothetical protein
VNPALEAARELVYDDDEKIFDRKLKDGDSAAAKTVRKRGQEMDRLIGLKIVASALFGSLYGPPLFCLGLTMSIALSLWARMPWRGLYWLFVIVGSAPLVALAVLPPIIDALGWANAYNPEAGLAFGIGMMISAVTSPFGVGVLLGALLAPVFRWGLSTG